MPEPKLRDRLMRMAASFQIDADLLAISRSLIDESRELLASLRDREAIRVLLKNSRAMIDESRRLLAALERPAPARRNDGAHHHATTTSAAAPIEPSADGVRADADRNPATLSVRVVKKESCFGWTVYSSTNDLLGVGNAETELKARINGGNDPLTTQTADLRPAIQVCIENLLLALRSQPALRRNVCFGQKQTSKLVRAMSALPPKADIADAIRNVRFVPKADILRCGKERRYSIIGGLVAGRSCVCHGSKWSSHWRISTSAVEPQSLWLLRLLSSSLLSSTRSNAIFFMN